MAQKLEQRLTEQLLVDDISKVMNSQLEKNGVAKLFVYGGAIAQAEVLITRVRRSIKILLEDCYVWRLPLSNREIKPSYNDERFIAIISSLVPADDTYADYHKINFDECLKMIGEAEFRFTHVPNN